MKLATIQNKEQVVRILTKSFMNNPTLLYIIRSHKNKEKHIWQVASYAFDFAIRRNGVYLSENGRGAAICYNYKCLEKDFKDTLKLLKAIVMAFSIRKIIITAYHNYKVQTQRPRHGKYLYFWFFGVEPDEQPKVSARDLALGIISMAKQQKLDLYAETTLEQNKRVYERFGFEVYKHWINPINNINVWFMRKRETRHLTKSL